MSRTLIAVAAALVAMVAGTASAVTLYSEDFEGGNPPESITNYGFDATEVPNTMVNNLGNTSTGFGVDGNSSDRSARSFGFSRISVPSPLTDPLGADYVLSFNAWAYRGSVGTSNAGVHLDDSDNGDQTGFGLEYARGGNGGWRFVTTFLGGGVESINDQNAFADDEVLATITIDLVNNMVSARLEHVSLATTPHEFTPVAITNLANLAAIDRLIILEDIIAGIGTDQGLDLDNLKITQSVIPEPASLVLLSLGALAALGRRRKA